MVRTRAASLALIMVLWAGQTLAGGPPQASYAYTPDGYAQEGYAQNSQAVNGYAPNGAGNGQWRHSHQNGRHGSVRRSEYNYDSGWVQNGQPQVVLAPDYPCAGGGAGGCPPARIVVTPGHGCGGDCGPAGPPPYGYASPNPPYIDGGQVPPEAYGRDRYGPPPSCCAGADYDQGGGYGYGYGGEAYEYHGFWKQRGPYRPVSHCGPPPPRGCDGGLRIPSSFFADGGGVGPDWIGGGGGGGGAIVFGGAAAGASAYASARASVHVSGGFRGRGGKGAHKGGRCCGK